MLSRAERAIRIQRFDQGEIQILINTFVLTEGFDSQPVSCVVLLRPSSHHSTYIQMIGRGLRTVDQAMYPRMQKDDCVILDFGTSTKEHGTLEQAVDLSPSKGQGKAPYKECFECGVRVAPKQMACPECGFEFGMESVDKQVDFDMVEVNTRLSDDAKIEWVDLFADNTVWFAHSRYNWCGVFAYQGKHHVVVGSRKAVTGVVYQGHFQTAIERAERWLQTQGAIDNIFTSTKYYANEPTESQLCQLPMSLRFNFNLTRYQAMCHLTLSRHKQAIFDVMTNDELDREVA